MPSTRLSIIALLLYCLSGCQDNPQPPMQIHTSFSEPAGLTVSNNNGFSQQLIKNSLAVRVVASEDNQWLVVEDMQFSNLVVIRAFKLEQSRYQEIKLPGIRQQWEKLAKQAGVAFAALIRPRVGIEGFTGSGNTVALHFQADTGIAGHPEIDALVEIALDSNSN